MMAHLVKYAALTPWDQFSRDTASGDVILLA